MKTDDNIEERLSRRFAAELDQAGRDYPTIGGRRGDGAEQGRRPRPAWPRLAVAMLAVAALATAGLIGLGLVARPGQGGPAAVALGADGLPNEIDGQTVYRVGDRASLLNLSGTFLLGGYVVRAEFPDVGDCPSGTPVPSAGLGLMHTCSGYGLGPTATSEATVMGMLSPDVLSPFLGSPVVVSAKGCISYVDPIPTACPPVPGEVVWPDVPAQIAGEHVYRAADQTTFATLHGSFLLGGRVSKPDVVPPCPAPLGKSDAETQLVPYCYWLSIDGLAISPKGTFDEPKDERVVARVHVSDPLAADCPADALASCQVAIVVESVVWRSDPYWTPSPSPAAVSSTPAEASGSAAPSPAQSAAALPSPAAASSMTLFGPDGVPIAIDGQPVLRAKEVPGTTTFLLGGPLTRDASCPSGEPAPDPNTAKPPACGYWMVDGVRVGAQTAIPETLKGDLVVARVTHSRSLAVCAAPPCPPVELLVVTEIVWTGPQK
jgi:hypothetical protein